MPKQIIYFICEYLDNAGAPGYAKTVHELAVNNDRLREALQHLAEAAEGAVRGLEQVGAESDAAPVRSAADAARVALED